MSEEEYKDRLKQYVCLSPPEKPKSEEEEELETLIAMRLEYLDKITDPAILNQLRDDLYLLGDMRQRRMTFRHFGPFPLFYEDHVAIHKRVGELAPAEFQQPLDPPINLAELPGGYRYRKAREDFVFSLSLWNYLEMCKAWDDPDQLSKEALHEWLEENCCSDWSKQDENGESFGGHWLAPEGSEERENCYEWSRRDNLKALCALPYPSRAIIWTVDWGCRTRMESVAFTVLCCEWLTRKRAQMKDIPASALERFGMTLKQTKEEIETEWVCHRIGLMTLLPWQPVVPDPLLFGKGES